MGNIFIAGIMFATLVDTFLKGGNITMAIILFCLMLVNLVVGALAA